MGLKINIPSLSQKLEEFSDPASSVSSINNIKTESVDLLDDISNLVGNAKTEVIDFSSDVTDKITESASDMADTLGEISKKFTTWFQNEATPAIEQAGENILNALNKTGATLATAATSLVEGIFSFTESIVDLGAIVVSGISSIPLGIIDLITDGHNVKDLWDMTKGFVSTNYSSKIFDEYYDKTAIGKWQKENSFFFDTTRSVGSGIGYTAGIVALTFLTAGIGGAAVGGASAASTATIGAGNMAVTAGVVGVGRGTQNAWNDGASVTEGLASGTLTGLWEGLQFYLGGKIGASNIFGEGEKVGIKLLNATSRVILDGLDGGVEGFVQPLIQKVYKDGSYQEVFNEAGGFKNVATQAMVGSIASAGGEALNLRKYLKQNDTTQVTPDIPNNILTEADVQNKLNRYEELLDIVNSEDYKIYKEYSQNGYAQRLRSDFNNVESELALLEKELTSYYQSFENNNYQNSNVQNSKVMNNGTILRNEINSLINPYLDEVSKARQIYFELNKRLHYNVEYFTGDSSTRAKLLNTKVSFDTLNSDTIVCKGWSELYQESLIDNGYDPSRIKISGTGEHKWITIDLGNDQVLIADSTSVVNHSNDLANCKAGFEPVGFVIAPKRIQFYNKNANSWQITDASNFSIEKLYKMSASGEFDINSLYTNFRSVDENLGYIKNGLDYAGTKAKADELFGNSALSNKIKNTRLDKIVDKFLNLDIPKGMDSYETYVYFNKIKRILFNDTDPVNITINLDYINTPKGVEAINIITTVNQKSGVKNYMLYSDSLGKQFFPSLPELYDYYKDIKAQ